jgi:hypothetical protein
MKLIQNGTHHLHIPRGYEQRLLHEYHLQKGCGLPLFIARTTLLCWNWNFGTFQLWWNNSSPWLENLTMQGEYNFIMKNDVLRKVVPSYIRKYTNIQNENLLMIWFFYHLKNMTQNLQDICTLSKNHIYSKWFLKNMSCVGKIISIFYNDLQKILFKNPFIWKSFFWVKIHVILV